MQRFKKKLSKRDLTKGKSVPVGTLKGGTPLYQKTDTATEEMVLPAALAPDTRFANFAVGSALEELTADQMRMKAQKNKEVYAILEAEETIPLNFLKDEVDYYFFKLGLHISYFNTTTSEDVANHILCIFSAKTLATVSNSEFTMDVKRETAGGALYISSMNSNKPDPNAVVSPAQMTELRLEGKFIRDAKETAQPTLHREFSVPKAPLQLSKMSSKTNMFSSRMHLKSPKRSKAPVPNAIQEGEAASSSPQPSPQSLPPDFTPHIAYRVRAYRSKADVDSDIPSFLWITFVERAFFRRSSLTTSQFDPTTVESNLEKVGSVDFLNSSTPEAKALCQSLIARAGRQIPPVLDLIDHGNANFTLTVCYRSAHSSSLFSTISNIFRQLGLIATKKELEPFHHFTVVTVDFEASKVTNPEWQQRMVDDISMAYVMPHSHFTTYFHNRTLSALEAMYSWSALLFIFYFCQRQMKESVNEYSYLEKIFKDPVTRSKLDTIVRAQQLTTWSVPRIRESMLRRLPMLREMCAHFMLMHAPANLKLEDIYGTPTAMAESLTRRISKLDNAFDQEVMRSCLEFNNRIIKTNMWRKNKSAVCFDIDPNVLESFPSRYPKIPYSILMMVGNGFRGFHVRFTDIARGGVRMVKSRSENEWARNAQELFFENYNLAFTQQMKNKDIPEGGSKGILLVHPAQGVDYALRFSCYIDALLDMLITDKQTLSPVAMKDPKITGRDDIIFLGPDEYTADLVGWASHHAHQRGYATWKAFTTGKSDSLGGIPHDVFGMTTRSVHQYVLGALEKMGLKESEVTKCQTGGPDGDLGSNEILISKDKTVAIIDGSGVLYDPAGLHRPELVRLAKSRQMVVHFNRKHLSAQGFLILLDDENVTLPDGTVVEDGLKFRNTFHFHPLFTADVFVPCGGRPAAVNMANIGKFAHVNSAEGGLKNRFKLVVEGANLFITQAARLVLEENGTVLFKDAAANKGGVTSSSLEVLAALTLEDQDFASQFCCPDPTSRPPLYTKYVEQVQAKIESNARREFDCLWNERQLQKRPISELIDTLSLKINTLGESIRSSPLLWNEIALRDKVIRKAVPKLLLEYCGSVEKFLQTVPEAYCQWIFASYLASDFIYSTGLQTTEFTFMQYMEGLRLGN